MKVELRQVTIRELVEGFEDNGAGGVVGFSGKLDIRPSYQREFVYKEEQQQAVIDSIMSGFPIGVFYWVVDGDTFEVLDGQQRSLSICKFVDGFNCKTINGRTVYFNALTQEEKDRILNYPLMIYFCEGGEIEKLEWFKTINIAGEELTNQELRNAIYRGVWLTNAKTIFSQTTCAAHQIAKDYLTGSPVRQEYLETVLDWISNGSIEIYMSAHQNDADANQLWLYFQNVIAWVKAVFPKYRKEMKGIEWGRLYNTFKDKEFNSTAIESEVARLMLDDSVTNKKGIYKFILTGEEKHLNIRAFTDAQKREAFEKQQGKCISCGNTFKLEEMEADHVTPWKDGGKTQSDNCQVLCKSCNRRKGGR